jgi:enamine deaminase RidA (YjgF/YER057c/UK114 family)
MFHLLRSGGRATASVSTSGVSRILNSQHNYFSSNITRLGVDILPSMSQVVIHNKVVYLAGQIDGSAEDIAGQTQNVLAKVDEYLAEAGTNKSKLLTSTIWLQDITRDFGAMNEVWNAWIDPMNKPVRATTEASLASPKYLVEIQVTASLE